MQSLSSSQIANDTNISSKNNAYNSNTSNTSSSSMKTTRWIEQFCASNRFLCKVDADYIMDIFNLIGLEEKVAHYRKALDIILDQFKESFDSPTSSDDGHEIEIQTSAEILYGLIHARFILTESGLKKMLEKYQNSRFGTCIRYYCKQAAMLPVGLSDQPGIDSVRLYCPRCMDIYVPHFSSKYVPLDGAYFGTSFPHMFFMVYPNYRPSPPRESFVPTLYGFKIHEQAYENQRKQSEAAERARKPMFKTSVISQRNPLLFEESHQMESIVINGINEEKKTNEKI